MSTETKPQTSASEGVNIDGAGAGAGTQPGTGDAKFTQADLDRIIRERLAEQKTSLETKLAKDREEADRKAAEEKARKDGELDKVITAKEAEIADLKPKADLADRLVATFTAQIEAESKEWPEEARDMLALAESVDKKLEVLPKARALAAKLSTGGTGSHPPGTAKKPEPKGGTDPKSLVDKAVHDALRSGGYGF
jgi:septal ring factor EnvC (AmiA/AmiB activator)